MREISCVKIKEIVSELCVKSNIYAGEDILQAFRERLSSETSKLGANVLEKLLENAEIAKNERLPICQDTGMAVVFVEIGQEAVIKDGFIEDAINEGVRDGYKTGYLRKSVVKDPIDRVNTTDNTPAVVHYTITEGDRLKITVAPKGFGSENMSALKMLKPSDGIEGVKRFVVETVKNAGSNPCPPIIVGIGIGGTMEKSALMAKQALLRSINERNKSPFWGGIEGDLLLEINRLGIGPAGFGGETTALCVNINTYATHIAGLPVAVNIGCHVTRHAEAEI